jgi:hypothetical protein
LVSDRAKRTTRTWSWIPTWRRSMRYGERLKSVTRSWRIRDTTLDDVPGFSGNARNTIMDFLIYERFKSQRTW